MTSSACQGVFVTKKYLLTLKSCVGNYIEIPGSIVIYNGKVIARDSRKIYVKRIIVDSNVTNPLAILKITNSTIKVNPMRIVNDSSSLNDGKECKSYHFGTEVVNGELVLQNERTQKCWSNFERVSEKIVADSNSSNTETQCGYDYGLPLVCRPSNERWILYGLGTSNKCTNQTEFIDLANYYGWIKSKVPSLA